VSKDNIISANDLLPLHIGPLDVAEYQSGDLSAHSISYVHIHTLESADMLRC